VISPATKFRCPRTGRCLPLVPFTTTEGVISLEDIWSKVGQDIDGEMGDESGCAASLNSDGSVLAVGGRYHDGINGNNAGNVRIYKRSGQNWTLSADY